MTKVMSLWKAIVSESPQFWIHRRNRVSYRGSYWDAKCEDNLRLLPGQFVKVVARKNTTLIVEPIASKLP
ncbi:NfeD family protein [Roseofilum casamattae]|uniref:NfeD family protein n=1 Tax=Roseofilum casamattae TaxID=3082944 RepID=UPI003D2F7460